MTRDDKVRVWSSTTQAEAGSLYVLVVAETNLRHRPKRTASGELVVPDRERRLLQQALEELANTVAVSYNARRRLSSPNPYVAFRVDDDDDAAFLASCVGILGPQGSARDNTSVRLGGPDQRIFDYLRDRMDGVALLAEALASDHPTGRFHEFIRVFERAFKSPASKLPTSMAQFLNRQFGYTEAELDHWCALRDRATHADARQSFVLEADVRPVISRMEQAAFDVLLNKDVWRDPSAKRRAVWFPVIGTTNAAGRVYIVQHSTPTMANQLSDQWGDYPIDFKRAEVPKDWWPAPPLSLNIPQQEQLEIIPAPEGVRLWRQDDPPS